MITDHSSNIGLIISAIVLEAVRFLTDTFIFCASDLRDRSSPPRLFDMLHKLVSPLYRTLQYLSYLYFEGDGQDRHTILMNMNFVIAGAQQM